jgi:hypothetical protein
MQFDLATILTHVDGPEDLTRPFTKQEIYDVIKFMPVDRAPGPDGFNGLFLKQCWSIVQEDFYQLADDFYNETIQLSNINGSYIFLVPKKVAPLKVNDFRPISLTNDCVKFLTKLAANRLQDKILSCIQKNH